MTGNEYGFHPYIPNSISEAQKQMLEELGLKDMEDLHRDIPGKLRLKEKMNIPSPLKSEYELMHHVEKILNKNKTCRENLNFLGAGCWQHYVPAICDEINQRSEFLTAYAGEPYEDHGRFQALFEYQSLVAELVDMDVVNVPTIDWAQAAATSIRMACRMTGRNEVLIYGVIDPDKLMVIKNYCKPHIKFVSIDYDKADGQMDLQDLRRKISGDTAAVYFENPSFLGFFEENGAEISRIAHEKGAECIVGVDPISLGVLEAPSKYGADIICGDLQPLGIHMNYGGGQAGFIATRDEVRYVMEYPSRLFGISPTVKEGEYGFGDVAYERTSFALREGGKEYVGTQAALWGITAGVYLSLMGPRGMWDVGRTMMQNSQYAAHKLSGIEGIKAPSFSSGYLKEFVVDFSGTGKTVHEINKFLLTKGIFGGKDLSGAFPELGQSALYCVTEIHTMEEIDYLAAAIEECLAR